MLAKIIHSLYNVLYWILYGFLISLIIWGANKGLDLSDEGWSLMFYNSQQEGMAATKPFFYMLGKLVSFLNPDIIFYRILRLVLLLGSSTFFTYGFLKWLKHFYKPIPLHLSNLFYPLIGIGTLLNYNFAYQALSYNPITLFFVQIVIGLFFLLHPFMKLKGIFSKQVLKYHLLISFGLTLLFIVKFPSAILIITLLHFVILIDNQYRFKEAILTMLKYFACTIIYMLFFFGVLYIIGGVSKEALIHIFHPQETIPGHDLHKIISHNLEDLYINFFRDIFKKHSTVIILTAAAFILFIVKWYRISLVVLLIMGYYFIDGIYEHELYSSGSTHYFYSTEIYRLVNIISIILMILYAIITILRKKEVNPDSNFKYNKLLIGCLIFFSIPFVCSLGTNVALSIHIIQFCFSWMLMFIFILLMLFNTKSFFYVLKAFVLILLLNSSKQIVNAFVYDPYRIAAPLTEQMHKLEWLEKGKNVKFDTKTALFLTEIKNILKENNIKTKGKPIMVLYNYPGLVYLFDGLSPGRLWYVEQAYDDNDKYNCRSLSMSRLHGLDKTLIFLESKFELTTNFMNCIKNNGIDFRDNYVLAGKVKKPIESDYLYIYIPKQKLIN